MSEKIIDLETIQKIETKMAKLVSDILDEHGMYYSFAYGSILGAVRHNGPIPWDLDMDMYINFDSLWDVIKILRDNLPAPYTVDYYDVNPKYRLFYPRVSLKDSSSDITHIDLFPLCGLPDEEDERIKFWNKVNKIDKIYYRYKNETYYVRKKNRAKWKYIIAYCLAKGKELIYLPITKKHLRKQFVMLFSKYPLKNSRFVAADPVEPASREIIEKKLITPTITHDYNGISIKIPQEYDSYLKQFYGDYMTIPDQELIDERMELTAVISEKDYNLIFNR